VIGFYITWLPHTQNQFYDISRNGLLVQCTLYFLVGWQFCFLLQLFPDPVKATSGQLAPFRGHGFVGIVVCNELGLHRQFVCSDITQLGVIWVQRGATKSHNLVSGLYLSSSSIYYSYIKPTHHLITTTCDIITRSKKAAQNKA